GPTEGLVPTIPQGTHVRALYVLDDGTAFVDLSEAVSEHHPGGSKSELLTVFSIVNSLVLNISEINAVKILVEGRETSTLAGHIDIRFPFKANMLLVR
ncbi:MAG: GerMN domain-containing protein, partial [Deltaproteobacteria bacterium]|nr:GerMN domain-containing protein [Deltaproteobacteria bacterium]